MILTTQNSELTLSSVRLTITESVLLFFFQIRQNFNHRSIDRSITLDMLLMSSRRCLSTWRTIKRSSRKSPLGFVRRQEQKLRMNQTNLSCSSIFSAIRLHHTTLWKMMGGWRRTSFQVLVYFIQQNRVFLTWWRVGGTMPSHDLFVCPVFG